MRRVGVEGLGVERVRKRERKERFDVVGLMLLRGMFEGFQSDFWKIGRSKEKKSIFMTGNLTAL